MCKDIGVSCVKSQVDACRPETCNFQVPCASGSITPRHDVYVTPRILSKVETCLRDTRPSQKQGRNHTALHILPKFLYVPRPCPLKVN